ncbi:MAG: GIY-YIG nuclease family protein [Chlorobium sp.]|nr:GIY-YIG nuclease family protein [Chlorobium sp.]
MKKQPFNPLSTPKFTIFGDNCRMGSYILFIRVEKNLSISFGRFQKGEPVLVEAGEYLYLGSALGNRPSGSPLAARLLRHASRSGKLRAHAIRKPMVKRFKEAGLVDAVSKKIPPKHTHWHADWLLDRLEAEITGVVAIRSPLRLEDALSEALALHPETRPLAPRLGAQDARSGTHLLRLTDIVLVETMLTEKIAALSDLLPT